jgi:hypothetical protein
MIVFETLEALMARFRDLGARRVFFKALSENDNSKQQIYLGGSFETLTYFPYGEVKIYAENKDPNYKAALDFWWVDVSHQEKATHAQLILYPQYPEVRLSGFLLGCNLAPSSDLQPVSKEKRRGRDGRILFFGTTEDGRTLAHLAPEGSPLATEALAMRLPAEDGKLLIEIPLPETVAGNSRQVVINALLEIQQRGFVDSIRLDKNGQKIPYQARNAGGYTLEALLGIRPNGNAAPDFMGWEIKAFSSDRITLMTPEPNGGYYGENGVGAFVRRYGRDIPDKDQRYFTGLHRYGQANSSTDLKLSVAGFDSQKGTILDVSGAIQLTHSTGELAASWSFASLLTHWNRKHAFAAYIPYEAAKWIPPQYKYINPVLFGEHTDFSMYVGAIIAGHVVFDPASKIDGVNSEKPRVKARSQFRIGKNYLKSLYRKFEAINLGPQT